MGGRQGGDPASRNGAAGEFSESALVTDERAFESNSERVPCIKVQRPPRHVRGDALGRSLSKGRTEMDEQLNGELQREIRKFQEVMLPKIPKEIVEALLTTTERQVKSGIAAKAKHEGDQAPNFSLRNTRGEPVELAKLLERGPAVVTFYRGGW